MFDLQPATDEFTRIVAGVRDDQLDAPTPCGDTVVAALLQHIDGFAQAFTAAATKTKLPGPQGPSADAAELDPNWRTVVPQRLAALAEAWRDEAAWSGEAEAGGVVSPAGITAHFALDEVIVHGWDLASATGQPYTGDPELLAIVTEFVRGSVASKPEGIPGLFGPAVPVPADAPVLAVLIGLTGRRPGWAAQPSPA